MKLWDKGFDINQKVEDFTVGLDRELDLKLALYDVQGNKAHAAMLERIGLLTSDENEQLQKELSLIESQIVDGQFVILDEIEDVHSQVEYQLTQKLGDLGKKIHAGRSRNDQVLVDLKLFFRAELKTIHTALFELIDHLLNKSEAHKDDLLPGYTHLQVAMPSSFGLWFGAYAETLVDDLRLLTTTYHITNQNPLGSGAGYGSSFPLDRQHTTEKMAFANLNYNVIHAQMGRGKTEQYISFCLAAISSTLAKFSMDVCLYNSQNFGFIDLPKEYTTGSSIMPHKKNPDVFEIIRGQCNILTNLPAQVMSLTNNLPSGYHRDLQLLKEILFPALQKLKTAIEICTFVIPSIEVRKNLLRADKYKYAYSVEIVNKLVMEGMPFRDAYKEVGQNLDRYLENYSEIEIDHSHEGSIGNLCTDQIRQKLKSVILV